MERKRYRSAWMKVLGRPNNGSRDAVCGQLFSLSLSQAVPILTIKNRLSINLHEARGAAVGSLLSDSRVVDIDWRSLSRETVEQLEKKLEEKREGREGDKVVAE